MWAFHLPDTLQWLFFCAELTDFYCFYIFRRIWSNFPLNFPCFLIFPLTVLVVGWPAISLLRAVLALAMKYLHPEKSLQWIVSVKASQLCWILCDPIDYRVHGILQARILEWVAIPFSRGSSQPRDWTQVSCTAGRYFTSWAIRDKPGVLLICGSGY